MEETIKYFLMPSNLITVLMVFGAMLWPLGFNRAGRISVAFAITLYTIFGSGPVSQYLLGNLEYRYPALPNPQITPASIIVVLTGGAEEKPLISVSSLGNPSSSYRIIEASIIYSAQPNRKIVITGKKETAVAMKKVFLAMGIGEQALEVDEDADNTFVSAVHLAKKMAMSALSVGGRQPAESPRFHVFFPPFSKGGQGGFLRLSIAPARHQSPLAPLCQGG